MNSFAQSFFPRLKSVVTQEAWNKSKVLLQHFSNISENVKTDSEQNPNNEEQLLFPLDKGFKNAEIKSDTNCEVSSTSCIAESLKHIEIKPIIKEPLINIHRSSSGTFDNSLKNIDIQSTINNIGKGIAGDWKIERQDFFQDDNLQGIEPILPKALDECKEDISYIGPVVNPTVNFASVANKSPLVQELCKLGVDFYKIEKIPANAKFLMSLDYENDIKPYIQFLNDCNVEPSELGKIITKVPKIFGEDLDDLKTRIRYLRAHAFNRQMIARIVTTNPSWLLYNTKNIDDKLGYFQYEFKLKGSHVRTLVVRSPELITYNMKLIKENTFAVKEEMGFNIEQTRSILLNRPVLWMHNRFRIVSCFDYVHNIMKISHDLIAKQPDILLHRRRRVQSRHMFLIELNKAQYDPTKPNYISLLNLVGGNDKDFCENIAKTTVQTYDLFMKTI